MKKNITIIISLILIALGFWFFEIKNPKEPSSIPPSSEGNAVFDALNANYNIEGRSVTLLNGKAEEEAAPGSASKIITQYFGNDAKGDLNGDGLIDMAFLLTQSGGGSGTFFYAVAAIKTTFGYIVTNAMLLGDRIAPQTTEIRDGELIVNYADRKPDEPMTASPSVGVSKYLVVEGMSLIEMVK